MVFRRHSLLVVVFLLAGMATSSAPASVMGPPQYYLRAEITDVSDVRGGFHEIRFSIEGLVQDQDKYGGSRAPDDLDDDLSVGSIHSTKITLDPELSVEEGDTIVVGVVHGSSMGEDGPVSWTRFARPYLVDGTPIGLHYPARNLRRFVSAHGRARCYAVRNSGCRPGTSGGSHRSGIAATIRSNQA